MSTETDRAALVERLAREAGASDLQGGHGPDLERFAALVAEECAKACEDLDAYSYDDPGSSAAAAIRARFGIAASQASDKEGV